MINQLKKKTRETTNEGKTVKGNFFSKLTSHLDPKSTTRVNTQRVIPSNLRQKPLFTKQNLSSGC